MGIPFKKDVTPADKTFQSSGLRLHYLDWGNTNAPTVIFLHGFAQTCHSWDFTCLSLCDRYHAVSLDQRGHGDSEWAPNGNYTLDAYVADLSAFIAHLGAKRPILVGLSMGGRNAFVHAARHLDAVSALAIVEAAPVWEAAGSDKVRRFVETVDNLDSPDDFVTHLLELYPMRTRQQLRGSVVRNLKHLPNGKWTWKYDRVLRTPGRNAKPSPKEVAQLWGYLESLACPTLVVRGARSDTISEATAVEMTRRIPNARLAIVPNAGHLVPGDNPTGFLTVLNDFLNSSSSGRRKVIGNWEAPPL